MITRSGQVHRALHVQGAMYLSLRVIIALV